MMEDTSINKGVFNDYLAGCLYTWNRSDLGFGMRLCNALIGMHGEMLEVVYDPSVDELGDALYYTFMFAYEFDGTIEHICDYFEEYYASRSLEVSVWEQDNAEMVLFDLMKKRVFHNHTLSDDQIIAVRNAYLSYFGSLLAIARHFDNKPHGLYEIMMFNQQKLRKRYPSGFNFDASINREENMVE